MDSPFIAAYRVAFLAYVGIMLTAVVRLSLRYRSVSLSRPALHLGLSVVVAGALLGLAYVLHGSVYVITRRLMIGYPIPDEVASTILGAVSVSLVVVGATMPEWGALLGIPQAYRWLDNRRACRRLYPLWHDLCRAAPDIALGGVPSPVADAFSVQNLGLRLYRRVVEIRDGRLAMACKVPPGTAERVERLAHEAGLTGHELLAIVEAACLRAAIRARMPYEEFPGNPRLPRTFAALDVAEEVAFLQLVADAYQHSPVVMAIVADVEATQVGSLSC